MTAWRFCKYNSRIGFICVFERAQCHWKVVICCLVKAIDCYFNSLVEGHGLDDSGVVFVFEGLEGWLSTLSCCESILLHEYNEIFLADIRLSTNEVVYTIHHTINHLHPLRICTTNRSSRYQTIRLLINQHINFLPIDLLSLYRLSQCFSLHLF